MGSMASVASDADSEEWWSEEGEVVDMYDPRKPEYIMPASRLQVEDMNIAMFDQQICRLQEAIFHRGNGDGDQLLEHYRSVLFELRYSLQAAIGRRDRANICGDSACFRRKPLANFWGQTVGGSSVSTASGSDGDDLDEHEIGSDGGSGSDNSRGADAGSQKWRICSLHGDPWHDGSRVPWGGHAALPPPTTSHSQSAGFPLGIKVYQLDAESKPGTLTICGGTKGAANVEFPKICGDSDHAHAEGDLWFVSFFPVLSGMPFFTQNIGAALRAFSPVFSGTKDSQMIPAAGDGSTASM